MERIGGLYNLTERIDDTFLATHFDHNDWDLVRTGPGDWEHGAWDAFVDWITGADLSDVVQYEQALQQLNIENFTSFIILELWVGDTDWSGGNWYAARMRDGPDARWRLLVWDAETTLGLVHRVDATEDISLSRVVIESGARGALIPILASLLASLQYQAYFTAQVERHLAGALATESVRDRLAMLVAELRPAMAAEAARWLPEQALAAVVSQWEAALRRIADSLDASEQRLRHLSDPAILRQHLPPLLLSNDLASLVPLPPDIRIALLVGHPAELTPGDAAVVTHLAERGATVTVLGIPDGNAPAPAQVAASHDLLLFSSSIRLIDTAARYAQTTTPLIFWGPRLLEATQLARWGGIRPEQAHIWITDADHPITRRATP